MGFPQFRRAFELGTAKQNASPSLGDRRVGAMATFPPRREGLKAILPHILSQLDELVLYLNEYNDVPDFLDDHRIRVVLGKDFQGESARQRKVLRSS